MGAYRVMTGVGEGLQSVAFVIAVSAFYPGSRTVAIALVQCALGFGQFIGPRLGAALLTSTGDWRTPFYAFGVLVSSAPLRCVCEQRLHGTAHGFTIRRQANSDSHMRRAVESQRCLRSLLWWSSARFLFRVSRSVHELPHHRAAFFPLAYGRRGAQPRMAGTSSFSACWLILRPHESETFQIVCLAVMAIAGYLIFNVATTPFEHELLPFVEGLAGRSPTVNGYSLAQRSVKHAQSARLGFLLCGLDISRRCFRLSDAKLVEAFRLADTARL
jgi:MFS family permease